MTDLASYGDLVTPAGDENVSTASGWPGTVLAFVEPPEEPLLVIDDIEAFEPV